MTRAVMMVLALAGCGVQEGGEAELAEALGAPDALPMDQAPPVYYGILETRTMVTGSPFRARVTGFPANTPVNLIGSTNVRGAGMCPAPLGGACVDLAAPFRTLDQAVTDGSGQASFSLNIPNNLGRQVELMAWARFGRDVYITSGALVDVLRYAGDEDNDGVSNGDELAQGTDPVDRDSDNDGLPDDEATVHGTDPLMADTDGGGTNDGAEVTMGTDPLDGSDDITPPCQGTLMDPGNGIQGCWYTAPNVGMTCDQVCQPYGGFDLAASQHSGNAVGVYYWPNKAYGSNWVSVECSSTDNNTNWGADGTTPDPNFSHPFCHVNCACFN